MGKLLDFVKRQFNNAVFMCRPIIRRMLIHPAVVLCVDGGTCSQLEDYVIIKVLEDKGIPVIADCTWYDSCDSSIDSVTARPFNIDKMFSLKPYKKATKFQVWLYKLLFIYHPTEEDKKGTGISVNLDSFQIPSPPCYLSGYYYYMDAKMSDYIHKYSELKNPEDVLDSANLQQYYKIIGIENTIGVHVRRGDMAAEGGYWKVIPAEYFINICNITELQDYTFYFFSEEPGWIKENIVPHIHVKYEVVENNPSYFGYKDLYLLSSCKYQVSSQGSFGLYAYMINSHKDKKLICYNEVQRELWEWRDLR